MVEDNDKPRRPAVKQTTDAKPAGSRSSAHAPAGTPRGDRPASYSNSSDRPRGDRPQSGNRGPRPQGGYQGSRPQGQGTGAPRGDCPQGSRPQGQGTGAPRGDRPQGGYQGGNRGPRPQGQGTGAPRPFGSRPAPKAAEDKSDEATGLGLSESEDSGSKTVNVPRTSSSSYGVNYRGSSARATGRNGSSPNKQGGKRNGPAGKPTKAATARQSMLNTHKLAPFKYDMNEVLSQSSMDPGMASSFLASIIAKASRISTKDAKEYAKTFVDAGNLTKDEFDKISKLMDRYSKFR